MNKNNYSQIVDTLYKAYEHFNKCFDLNLSDDVLIYIAPTGRKKAYGWFKPKSWHLKEQVNEQFTTHVLHEINIAPQYLNREPNEVFETLLHEMAHAKNEQLQISDCNSAQYHNKNFKLMAEQLGLVVEKHKTRGWAVTHLGENAQKAIDTFDYDKNVFMLCRPQLDAVQNTTQYITIALNKEEWADDLVLLRNHYHCESNSELVKLVFIKLLEAIDK